MKDFIIGADAAVAQSYNDLHQFNQNSATV